LQTLFSAAGRLNAFTAYHLSACAT
jgi:hypothetical protein